MKKIVLFLTLSIVSQLTLAHEGFDFDEETKELENLNELESFVLSNPGFTWLEVQSKNANLLKDVSDDTQASFLTDGRYESTLGIPPFFWGCVLGVIGILLVYIVSDNDREATKRALIGCITTFGVAAVFYLAVWLFALGTWSTF